MKHYGRYGFPSDPIVDYSIFYKLIYIALNITWNNLQWRLYFFINDWWYMCDFEHECPFDIKRQENILCKIPSDSNARNIILYCEFSNAVLGHSIRTFSGMNEKTQSTVEVEVLHFYVRLCSGRLCTPRPLGDQHGNWCVVFLLSVRVRVRVRKFYL